MPLVIFHHLLNLSVQLASKRGLKKYIVTRQRLDNNITAGNEYTRNIRRMVERVVFYLISIM
jgi:hypothetical protein